MEQICKQHKLSDMNIAYTLFFTIKGYMLESIYSECYVEMSLFIMSS